MTDVRFYLDYNSPYSYLASRLIEGICQRQGAELKWQPFVLGGVFKAVGHTPAFQLPMKGNYMWQDLEDLSSYHGIAYTPRSTFLFNPMLSLRATVAVPQGALRAKAVHALFRGAFAEDRDLGDAAVVQALLEDAGLDGAGLVEAAKTPEVKLRLREDTDEAIRLGLFGAPSFVVGPEEKLFWGQDRLTLLEHYLKTGGTSGA